MAILAGSVGVALPSVASAGELVPLSSRQIECPLNDLNRAQSVFTNLPVTASAAAPAIFSLSSDGANALLNRFDPNPRIRPGEQIWGAWGALAAGDMPRVELVCNPGGGTVTITLYDAPTAPVTFSGAVSASDHAFEFPFRVPGGAQYVADAVVSQGAIRLSDSGRAGQTVAASEQVPLGFQTRGIGRLRVTGLGGPLATFSITIRSLPVTISDLRFLASAARPAVPLTADFSVSGQTRITAVVEDARGRTVNSLGSFGLGQGRGSVTWNGRTKSDSPAASGTYRMVLTSEDAVGNVTRASAPVVIDGKSPRVRSVSRVGPRQGWSATVIDTGSGTRLESATIDGQRRTRSTFSSPRRKAVLTVGSPRGGWLPGRHTFEVTATDVLGNRVTRRGTFSVPIGGRRVVLGSRSFAGPYGGGFGASRPSDISNNGTGHGSLFRVRWRSWGGFTAYATALIPVLAPNGSYYPRLLRGELRATDVGRCTANGPLAYRQLWYRTPRRPGGPLGRWRRWSGDQKTICRSPFA